MSAHKAPIRLHPIVSELFSLGHIWLVGEVKFALLKDLDAASASLTTEDLVIANVHMNDILKLFVVMTLRAERQSSAGASLHRQDVQGVSPSATAPNYQLLLSVFT